MSSRYMKIKEDSRFQRRKIEDDTKNCPAGGEDGKANVIYLLLSSSVFFYLRRKWLRLCRLTVPACRLSTNGAQEGKNFRNLST